MSNGPTAQLVRRLSSRRNFIDDVVLLEERGRKADEVTGREDLGHAGGAASLIKKAAANAYDEGPDAKTGADADESSEPSERLLAAIRDAVVGAHEFLPTPFGPRRMTYADWTASGRPLRFLEKFIAEEVHTVYGNTHTTASATGLQSTLLRAEARGLVHKCVNGSDEDTVFFTGSGTTGGVMLLLRLLGLNGFWSSTHWIARGARVGRQPPLVIVGPYEHHSNVLPWVESGAQVIMLREQRAARGASGVNVEALRRVLERHAAGRPLLVCALSAASNVTGIAPSEETVLEATALVHEFGGLSVWDYAAAAPHGAVDMNPAPPAGSRKPRALYAKDAVYFAPHKLAGGPGTPGVLVVKRRIIHNEVPSSPGGGTVLYVSHAKHVYLQNVEEREEGGTPDIIGAIRCGLTLQLKAVVGDAAIRRLEDAMLRRVLPRLRAHPRLVVLGAPEQDSNRVGIVSFLVRTPPQLGGRFLHHHFVATLLNDLFGIQCRSGCGCAGPYGHDELGVDEATSEALLHALMRGSDSLGPGFSRVSLHYFASSAEVDFLADAVLFVAEHGWKLLACYTLFPSSSMWRHVSLLQDGASAPARRSLHAVSYGDDGAMRYEPAANACRVPDADRACDEATLYARYLKCAEAEAARVEAAARRGELACAGEAQPLRSAEDEALRWFVLPCESVALLRSGTEVRWERPCLRPVNCDCAEEADACKAATSSEAGKTCEGAVDGDCRLVSPGLTRETLLKLEATVDMREKARACCVVM